MIVGAEHQKLTQRSEIGSALELLSILPSATQRRKQNADEHDDDRDDDKEFYQSKTV